MGTEAPAGVTRWPAELQQLFERAVTVEYASLTRSDAPVTVPVTPFVSDDGRTLDVSTGLTYPAKAERARRNPRVALLFSDGMGSGLDRPPVALVQGLAAVRDADLQANTDRYVRLALAKTPASFDGQPKVLLRTLAWYFARIWVQVTPTRILWWPEGRLDEAPREWTAPAGTTAPPSDPPPAGRTARAFLDERTDWRWEATEAAQLPMRDLTTVGDDGFPLIVPATDVETTHDGFCVTTAAGADPRAHGPACMTFHTHSVPFAAQQNRSFAGRVAPEEDGRAEFVVERLLADWSTPATRVRATLDFLATGRRLRPRLRAEAARRGQPAPAVRFQT